ncbi:MAG: glycosyltransferase family 4 protein [Leptolyngbya sp. SIO3F4]|nr:glycosyltransferase family 4 protein [Leptolyngbya sp. SIO3F4]
MTYPRGFDAPGGGTKSLLQIIHSLQKLGVHIISVPLSAKPNGGLSQSLVDSLLGEGVSVSEFEVFPAQPNGLHYLLNGISTANVVKQLLRDRDIDAVISWEHEAAFLIGHLASKGIPFAMIAASPSYELLVKLEKGSNFLKKLVNSWFRWRSFRVADCVFVSSKFTLDELVKLFGIKSERIQITYRGIDSIFFDVDRTETSTISNFIFYGSFSHIKGLPDVIEALGILLSQGFNNWQLKIAGWGDLDTIKKKIHKAGIEKNVAFLGRLSPPELVNQLKNAHLALLPSRAESFGRSIAEAQATALPVVSYATGSIPEIIEHDKTGWLASPGRPDLLAQAIKVAMHHPEVTFQMGLEGQKSIQSRFSWEKTANLMNASIQKAKSYAD